MYLYLKAQVLCSPSAQPQTASCTSHSTGCVQVRVTQRGTRIYHVGATLLRSPVPLGAPLQGLD